MDISHEISFIISSFLTGMPRDDWSPFLRNSTKKGHVGFLAKCCRDCIINIDSATSIHVNLVRWTRYQERLTKNQERCVDWELFSYKINMFSEMLSDVEDLIKRSKSRIGSCLVIIVDHWINR